MKFQAGILAALIVAANAAVTAQRFSSDDACCATCTGYRVQELQVLQTLQGGWNVRRLHEVAQLPSPTYRMVTIIGDDFGKNFLPCGAIHMGRSLCRRAG